MQLVPVAHGGAGTQRVVERAVQLHAARRCVAVGQLGERVEVVVHRLVGDQRACDLNAPARGRQHGEQRGALGIHVLGAQRLERVRAQRLVGDRGGASLPAPQLAASEREDRRQVRADHDRDGGGVAAAAPGCVGERAHSSRKPSRRGVRAAAKPGSAATVERRERDERQQHQRRQGRGRVDHREAGADRQPVRRERLPVEAEDDADDPAAGDQQPGLEQQQLPQLQPAEAVHAQLGECAAPLPDAGAHRGSDREDRADQRQRGDLAQAREAVARHRRASPPSARRPSARSAAGPRSLSTTTAAPAAALDPGPEVDLERRGRALAPGAPVVARARRSRCRGPSRRW